MKIPPLIFILFLLVLVGICGCMQKVSDNGTKLDFDIPSTPMMTATTVPIQSTSTTVGQKDPVIGYWYCFIYPSWGARY